MAELTGCVLEADNSVILLVNDWINCECLFIREKDYTVAMMLETIEEATTVLNANFLMPLCQEWSLHVPLRLASSSLDGIGHNRPGQRLLLGKL